MWILCNVFVSHHFSFDRSILHGMFPENYWICIGEQLSAPVGCIPPVCCHIPLYPMSGAWVPTPGHTFTPWTYSYPGRGLVTEIPSSRLQADRHLWKHYLPATSLAGGNNAQTALLTGPKSMRRKYISDDQMHFNKLCLFELIYLIQSANQTCCH